MAKPDPTKAKTPESAYSSLLEPLELGPSDVLYDPGCGDASLLIAACQKYGCRGVGVEIDDCLARQAKANVQRANVSVRIVNDDCLRYICDEATAVVMYMEANIMAKLMPRIQTDRVVSYLHPIPGRSCRLVRSGDHKVYVAEPLTVSSQYKGWKVLN